jgi:hypothetical protein
MYEGFALLRKAEEAVAAPAGQQPDEPLDQQRRLYLEAIDKFKEVPLFLLLQLAWWMVSVG